MTYFKRSTVDAEEPFEHVTTELCSEDVTSSKVLPLINCLNLALESAEIFSEVAMVLQLYLKEEVEKKEED